ncbi:MAG: AraC family transcriptional regulator, partial [Candidatus Eremiobacteraeota bacterium]|nr:AraC family transcriptional regulator [Candidatus Eremiobacteraeota bacterium]
HARACAAAELLLQTEALPFAQIALECGYYDQSHFCRQFKDAVGMTPTDFRRRFLHDQKFISC